MAAIRAVSSSLVRRPVPIRSVMLGHEDSGVGVHAYEPFLGARPEFGTGAYALELEGRVADWPIATANNEMLESLDARADQLLGDLGSGRTVSDRVIRAIGRKLRGEPPKIDDVAKGLAMSPRTLQRALSAEGATYHDLLDRTRRGLAMRYLADSDAVIFEVAILLGFSEPSAFHRAFKRWTGYTPRQFQRLATNDAAL